jgi:hypothetical protein
MMSDEITIRIGNSASSRRLTNYWCTECMQLVTMVSVEEASALAGTNLEAMGRQVAELKIHTMQSSAAVKFICFPSLLKKG